MKDEAPPESYEAAQRELADILDRLRNESADVDQLECEVARAQRIIRWSRQRLRAVEAGVDELVASTEGDVNV